MSNYSTLISYLIKGLLLTPLCLCLACAQHLTRLDPPKTHPPRMTFAILRDYNTTCNAMVRAVADLPGHIIQLSQERTGAIVVEPVTVEIEGNCDCGRIGGVPLAGPAKRQTTIKVRPKAPQKTLVEISCKYTISYTWNDIYGKAVRTRTITCTSNGRFEQKLHRGLTRYLGISTTDAK